MVVVLYVDAGNILLLLVFLCYSLKCAFCFILLLTIISFVVEWEIFVGWVPDWEGFRRWLNNLVDAGNIGR